MKKRVAIIGAGVSGLPAIKCCLDEDLEPVCFERTGDIGGLWNYEQGLQIPNRTSVTSSTVTITSKEMSCYSDFPFPKEFPIFMPHYKILEYLRMYAKNFNLNKYILFNTEVIKVSKTDDFRLTGNWNVTYKCRHTEEEKLDIFQGVMICSGAFSEPRLTTFEGQQEFTGRVLHSREYKSHHGFENKKIIVVGTKASGADIAVELSGLGSQVYLSSRRGSWMTGRLFDGCRPADVVLSNRLFLSVFQSLPTKLAGNIMKSNLNKRFDHQRYGLQPKHLPGLESGSLTNADNLPERILSGRIIIKPSIKKLLKTSVVFEDDTTLDNVDAVILATGYRINWPYLDSELFKMKNGNIDLYRTMFSPDLDGPQTIAMIAGIFVTGGIMPLAEMQCRVATRIFKGDVQLPSRDEMLKEIKLKKKVIDEKRRKLNYENSDTMDDGYGYMFDYYLRAMTTLSEMCGCAPSFSKLLRMDLRLACNYLFGPAVPAQFRLCGHGSWEGAKETVLASEEHAYFSYSRSVQGNSSSARIRQNKKMIRLFMALVVFTGVGVILQYLAVSS